MPEIPVQHRNEVSIYNFNLLTLTLMAADFNIISCEINIYQVRRMILMIDALYEAKTCVFVLAAVPPLKLLQITDEEKAKSLYDEVFAFDRTVSRLIEMQSAEYLKAVALSRKIGASYLQSIGAKLRSLDVQQTDNADINLHIKLFNQIWQEYNVNFDDETSTLRKADLVVLLHDLFYSYFMAMQIKQTIVEQTMVTTSFSNFVSSVFDDTKLNEWSQSDFCALLSRLDWISHNDAYSVK